MELLKNANNWKAAHRNSVLIAVFRMILGLIILGKGIYFIQNTEALQAIISTSNAQFGSVVLAHLIAMFHLTGGLLIAIGAVTRIAIIFQLPILLGAIIFVHIPQIFSPASANSVLSISSEFLLSLVVFLGLLFYLFFGSGTYSVDRYIRKYDYNV